MKSVKRIISLLLVLVMSLAFFTGCKEEKKEETSGDRVLTVGIPQNTTIPDYDKNALSLYLEEVTGIDVRWVFFSSSASNYKQQLTLMCTGKEELPDVLLGFSGLGHYVVNQFAIHRFACRAGKESLGRSSKVVAKLAICFNCFAHFFPERYDSFFITFTEHF